MLSYGIDQKHSNFSITADVIKLLDENSQIWISNKHEYPFENTIWNPDVFLFKKGKLFYKF